MVTWSSSSNECLPLDENTKGKLEDALLGLDADSVAVFGCGEVEKSIRVISSAESESDILM